MLNSQNAHIACIHAGAASIRSSERAMKRISRTFAILMEIACFIYAEECAHVSMHAFFYAKKNFINVCKSTLKVFPRKCSFCWRVGDDGTVREVLIVANRSHCI